MEPSTIALISICIILSILVFFLERGHRLNNKSLEKYYDLNSHYDVLHKSYNDLIKAMMKEGYRVIYNHESFELVNDKVLIEKKKIMNLFKENCPIDTEGRERYPREYILGIDKNNNGVFAYPIFENARTEWMGEDDWKKEFEKYKKKMPKVVDCFIVRDQNPKWGINK